MDYLNTIQQLSVPLSAVVAATAYILRNRALKKRQIRRILYHLLNIYWIFDRFRLNEQIFTIVYRKVITKAFSNLGYLVSEKEITDTIEHIGCHSKIY